jgi:hypothetical protein
VTGARPTIFYAPLIACVTKGFLEKQAWRPIFHWLGATPCWKGFAAERWMSSKRCLELLGLGGPGRNDSAGAYRRVQPARRILPGSARLGSRFDWKQLEGKTIVAELGGQPAHMLRYALGYNKVDISKVRLVDGGTGPRCGPPSRVAPGDFAQFPGRDGATNRTGRRRFHCGLGRRRHAGGGVQQHLLPPPICKNTSLPAFSGGFRTSQGWAHTAPASEVATNVAPQFQGESLPAMTKAIEAYQRLGCWSGPLGISKAHYDQAWKVFQAAAP